jgi:hypothetical protein
LKELIHNGLRQNAPRAKPPRKKLALALRPVLKNNVPDIAAWKQPAVRPLMMRMLELVPFLPLRSPQTQ